jgi:hypothetical protein
MMKLNALLILMLAASPASAAPASASQCKAGETTYFNCAVKHGAKVVSLCGKGNGGAGSYLQYRYGAPGQQAELVHPSTKRYSAMGETFFFDSTVPKDGGRNETGVWFEHENTYYELKYTTDLAASGQTTGGESEILMWLGVPSGAPRPLVCKQAHGGASLHGAAALIEAMSPPGRAWKMSPLDVYYLPKPPAPKAD